MKYALFVGCFIQASQPDYEFSVREVLPHFGVELVDMQGASCCAPFSIQSINYPSSVVFAARNLCIAEEMGLDVVVLCNDCYESLLSVNTILRENPEDKDQINEVLSEVDREFKGKVQVKHLVDVLYNEVGIDKIKKAISNPLTDLKVGTQPGCHLTRPKRLHADILKKYNACDELVKVTGAQLFDYPKRDTCCGGLLRGVDDELSRTLLRQKLIELKNMAVDCVVTVCPFCYLQFDIGQLNLKKYFNEKSCLPAFHFITLLKSAMGIKLGDWEVKMHSITLGRNLKDRLQGVTS